MKCERLSILLFGFIEIAIGSATLLAVIFSLLFGKATKPLAVLIFVLTTSIISLSLGIGLLRLNLTSCYLLIFFSTVIILSKVIAFAKIINLSGALETSIPPSVKNIISIIYHSMLILFLTQPSVKNSFGGRRNIISAIR